MPSHAGPNTLGESNLVFAHDTGDVSNSYKGKPGYNVLGTPYAWVGNSTATYFKTNVSTASVNIPAIGTREVATVSILNDYPNSGNCCPSLWRYGDWGITSGVVGNTLYTYSIIYKTNSGYTHPNFMYRYEYNGGSYILETGIFDTAKRIDLGDGWYQAYNTFTTNASTNVMYLGMWYYQYGVQDTVYLYKASLTQGTHTFPPEQMIPPSTTRSATQGLLPVIGNSTIDLTNVSFDSNAKMLFDGTNDTISITSYPAIELVDNVSIEYIYKRLSTDPVLDIIANKYSGTGWELFCQTGNTFALAGRNGDGTYYSTSNAAYTIQSNTYYHLVAMKEGLSWRLYVNGVLYAYLTANSVGTWSNTGVLQIGGEGSDYYPNMELPVFKIYNRALTTQEIRQNYQQYKTRFNLS